MAGMTVVVVGCDENVAISTLQTWAKAKAEKHQAELSLCDGDLSFNPRCLREEGIREVCEIIHQYMADRFIS